jgi:hypothetical protein
MLGAAIKNTIIMGLLILILYMLIRNALLESFPTGAPLALPARSEQPASPRHLPRPACAAPAAPDGAALADELLEWAYPSSDKHEEVAACTPIRPEPPEVPKRSDRQGHPPSEQVLKNAVVMKEYSNENVMNGGALFAGLHGYDGAQATWSSVGDAGAPLLPQQPPRPCGKPSYSKIAQTRAA